MTKRKSTQTPVIMLLIGKMRICTPGRVNAVGEGVWFCILIVLKSVKSSGNVRLLDVIPTKDRKTNPKLIKMNKFNHTHIHLRQNQPRGLGGLLSHV